jgi:hypothetical protein
MNPKKGGDPTCAQCTDNVKKVPRVVMVDQLWMWILDESEPDFHYRRSIFQIDFSSPFKTQELAFNV